MNNFGKQSGYGLIEWIFIVSVIAFFMLLAFRVIPLYSENQYVIAGLKDLVRQTKVFLKCRTQR